MKVSKDFLIDESNKTSWNNGLKHLYSDNNNIVEMTEYAYNNFLNCVPPIYQQGSAYLSGEPYRHDENGNGVYLAAVEVNGRYYAQMSTKMDFISGKLFKKC